MAEGRLRFVPKDLEPLVGYYATLPKEPLMVRARLSTPYVPAEPDGGGACHLDSILAYAVFAHLPYPVRTGGADGIVTPLPLKLSWIKDGLPLWCSSDLRPQGDVLRDNAYWHKRWPDGHLEYMSKRRANVKSGRNKEMRVPLATVQTAELRAVCAGNAEKVEELLSHVSHVGKKPSQGHGRVSEWSVEPLPASAEDAEATALLARPVPLEYVGGLSSGVARHGAFTHPYWFAPWWCPVVTRA
jgi:hypothetical protein